MNSVSKMILTKINIRDLSKSYFGHFIFKALYLQKIIKHTYLIDLFERCKLNDGTKINAMTFFQTMTIISTN